MKLTHILVLLIALVNTAYSQKEILLYPRKIPNSRKVPDPERIEHRGGRAGRAFVKTSIPTLAIFQPSYPNGKALIVCPGGGYAKTAYDKEGVWVAEALLEDSITVFVLKYRIPQVLTNEDPSMAPLQDAQQAIRYVRKNAGSFQIDSQRIGIMGFSAGGHLAASAATHFEMIADKKAPQDISVRPDFVALVYPVISFTDELTHLGSRTNLIGAFPDQEAIYFWSNELQVSSQSPPAFLIHAADDQAVPVGNSLAYYEACIEKGVPVEMHLYPAGGHGFGLYNTTTQDIWIDRLRNWLKGL